MYKTDSILKNTLITTPNTGSTSQKLRKPILYWKTQGYDIKIQITALKSKMVRFKCNLKAKRHAPTITAFPACQSNKFWFSANIDKNQIKKRRVLGCLGDSIKHLTSAQFVISGS